MGKVETDCFEEDTDELKRAVDFECTFCEAVLKDAKELEAVLKKAYALTVERVRGVYDAKIIRDRWFGMWTFSQELYAAAAAIQERHPICGVDMDPFEQYLNAAYERMELHCPKTLNA